MPPGSILELDIGGTLFKTSRSTLTKFDGFFKTMLETDIPVEKDENGLSVLNGVRYIFRDDGSVFIDRDPKHFRLILNFIRDGFVNIPKSKSDIQEIQTEAQYYLLDGLVKLCGKPLNLQVSIVGNTTELIDAISRSTKQAAIIVEKLELKLAAALRTDEILRKYGAKFDIIIWSGNMFQESFRVRNAKTGESYKADNETDLQAHLLKKYKFRPSA